MDLVANKKGVKLKTSSPSRDRQTPVHRIAPTHARGVVLESISNEQIELAILEGRNSPTPISYVGPKLVDIHAHSKGLNIDGNIS